MKTARSYHQQDRAIAAGRTRTQILDVAEAMFLERWYDDVGVREIATAGGVATQTVVNHFGTKAGVLSAVAERVGARIDEARDAVLAGDVSGAVTALTAEYEAVGDGIVRMLALEGRIAELEPLIAHGRAVHRAWIERVFAENLGIRDRARRQQRTVALIAATDVLTWKVLRREQGLGLEPTRQVMNEMVCGLIAGWGRG